MAIDRTDEPLSMRAEAQFFQSPIITKQQLIASLPYSGVKRIWSGVCHELGDDRGKQQCSFGGVLLFVKIRS